MVWENNVELRKRKSTRAIFFIMHPIECLTIIPPVLSDSITVTGKPQIRTNSIQFLPLDDERWRVKTTHDFVTSTVWRGLGITKPIFVHHGRASTWYPINPK